MILMDDIKLRPAPSPDGESSLLDGNLSLNRRQFLRHGFNAASGVLAATLGALGFAAILLPPSGGEGGDKSVLYWAKGREDEAWYGAKHLKPMMKSDDRLIPGRASLIFRILDLYSSAV